QVDRDLSQDVATVVEREKRIRHHAQRNDHYQQRQQRLHAREIHTGRQFHCGSPDTRLGSAYCMIVSGVASAAASSATCRPSRITSIRCESASTSGSSEDASTTAS